MSVLDGPYDAPVRGSDGRPRMLWFMKAHWTNSGGVRRSVVATGDTEEQVRACFRYAVMGLSDFPVSLMDRIR